MPWCRTCYSSVCWKISLRCSACSAVVRENIRMSSMKTITKSSRYSWRMSCTKCMNCEGVFVTPNDITRNLYDPQRILKVVLGTSSLHTGICQYPDRKSFLLNTWAPHRQSIISSGNGRGYQFLIVSSYSANGSQRKTEGCHLSSVRIAPRAPMGTERVV